MKTSKIIIILMLFILLIGGVCAEKKNTIKITVDGEDFEITEEDNNFLFISEDIKESLDSIDSLSDSYKKIFPETTLKDDDIAFIVKLINDNIKSSDLLEIIPDSGNKVVVIDYSTKYKTIYNNNKATEYEYLGKESRIEKVVLNNKVITETQGTITASDSSNNIVVRKYKEDGTFISYSSSRGEVISHETYTEVKIGDEIYYYKNHNFYSDDKLSDDAKITIIDLPQDIRECLNNFPVYDGVLKSVSSSSSSQTASKSSQTIFSEDSPVLTTDTSNDENNDPGITQEEYEQQQLQENYQKTIGEINKLLQDKSLSKDARAELTSLKSNAEELYRRNKLTTATLDSMNKKTEEINKNIKLLKDPIENYEEIKKLLEEGYSVQNEGASKSLESAVSAQKTLESEDCKKDSSEDKCKKAQKTLDTFEKVLSTFSPEVMIASATTSCDQEPEGKQCQLFTDSFTKSTCSDALISSVCELFTTHSQDSITRIQMMRYTSELDQQLSQGKLTQDQYNKQLNKFLTEQIGGIDSTLKLKSEESLEDYQKRLDQEYDNCNNDEACKRKIKRIQNMAEIAQKNTYVETNVLYDIINAIKNPDPAAMKTAEFFGFEKDYSNLPKQLGQSFESQICLNKIEGYLDKEIKNDGGVTKYTCEDKDNPHAVCLQVEYDLRGQRSEITPDNKTVVTYSYYLKEASDIKLLLTYKQNGNFKEFMLENKTGNETSTNIKQYNSVTVPLNNTQGIDHKSFKLKIDTDIIEAEYPVLLLSTKTLKETITNNGNSDGNEQALIQIIE